MRIFVCFMFVCLTFLPAAPFRMLDVPLPTSDAPPPGRNVQIIQSIVNGLAEEANVQPPALSVCVDESAGRSYVRLITQILNQLSLKDWAGLPKTVERIKDGFPQKTKQCLTDDASVKALWDAYGVTDLGWTNLYLKLSDYIKNSNYEGLMQNLTDVNTLYQKAQYEAAGKLLGQVIFTLVAYEPSADSAPSFQLLKSIKNILLYNTNNNYGNQNYNTYYNNDDEGNDEEQDDGAYTTGNFNNHYDHIDNFYHNDFAGDGGQDDGPGNFNSPPNYNGGDNYNNQGYYGPSNSPPNYNGANNYNNQGSYGPSNNNSPGYNNQGFDGPINNNGYSYNNQGYGNQGPPMSGNTYYQNNNAYDQDNDNTRGNQYQDYGNGNNYNNENQNDGNEESYDNNGPAPSNNNPGYNNQGFDGPTNNNGYGYNNQGNGNQGPPMGGNTYYQNNNAYDQDNDNTQGNQYQDNGNGNNNNNVGQSDQNGEKYDNGDPAPQLVYNILQGLAQFAKQPEPKSLQNCFDPKSGRIILDFALNAVGEINDKGYDRLSPTLQGFLAVVPQDSLKCVSGSQDFKYILKAFKIRENSLKKFFNRLAQFGKHDTLGVINQNALQILISADLEDFTGLGENVGRLLKTVFG